MEANDPDTQNSAGSIIKPNWVLTARHVVIEPKTLQLSKLLVSPKYSNKVSELKGKKKYEVKKMFCYHVTDDGSDVDYADIALLKLSENIPLGTDSEYGFQTVPLIGSYHDVDWTKEVKIVGWGQTRHDFGENLAYKDYADHLMVLSTKLNPTEECRNFFPTNFRSPETFCVGHEFKTAGHADSGGPAIMKHVDKNIDIQVGVVSYGLRDTRGPTVFGNLSFFLPWIKNRMNDEDPKWECKNIYAKYQ